MSESELLSKMADIELPAPPDWQPVLFVIITLTLLLAAGLIVWRSIRHNKTPTSHANIKQSDEVLEELRQQWSAGHITDREASYRLSTLLRLSLGLPQLSTACPANITNDAAVWEKTIRHLHYLRYGKTVQEKLSSEDFNNAGKWLLHAQGESQQSC